MNSSMALEQEVADSQLAERANVGLHESLLAHLPADLRADDPILDIGCGSGAWLARLAARGFTNLNGVDRDIRQAQVRDACLTTVDLDRPAWGPLGGPFALITAIEVVEHVENTGIFFDRLGHYLADGGTIILTTPNVQCLASRLRFLLLNQLKQFDELGDPTHVTPVLLSTLPRVLERHGLQIVERWGFPNSGRTVSSRGWVNFLCSALRLVLAEPVPGDNLCLRITREGRVCPQQ